MKFFHTADWHLGKLVQSVYMTEDQQYVLEQLLQDIEKEKPDAVIIAGDLYDRAVPPTEAVQLLDRVLKTIVLDLKTPVLAVSGNHDSPSRLNFGSDMMRAAGLHMAGEFAPPFEPVVLYDEHGPVHCYLVPYADPATVRQALQAEEIHSYDDAMRATVARIRETLTPGVRSVFVGHAFVTPGGEAEPNTSDSERPLAIGGAEHVRAAHFDCFVYTALGHLHQAHFVGSGKVQYAGSPLKYSISEEKHRKGYLVVELEADGSAKVEKRLLTPRRDMRTVEALMEEIERGEKSEDYIYVRLLDKLPVLSPMERIRAVYPNAMHVERKAALEQLNGQSEAGAAGAGKAGMDMMSLFRAFYQDAKGSEVSEETEQLFLQVLREIDREEGERIEANQAGDDGVRAV
ncbi:exonuclease SbcCD subunit D [Cohnella lubricantis]|uniref:Nuclease SbcCD subunit D n=1 Tax=Cohnella lubricantis TaxID=2163172 RepID=A0A841T9W3_9BACL|nr:exonuclease SbcCD subunit D [Cohnella lubricantis]MBB6675827.1 exonuclease SbcCD subunit D [Cohnella lubricantis]MBP2119762.1 exonuclease SbcD [Cohnella lubricantis]